MDDLSLANLLGEKFHPLQPEVILATEFEVAVVGGMGAGKSYAACVAAIRHGAKYPGARVLIGRYTYREMVDSTKFLFFQIVESKGLKKYFDRPRNWNYKEGTNYARMIDGSEFIFSNLDQKLDRHKNVEYSFIFIDQGEEIPYEVYELLRQRCRYTVCPSEDRHIITVANDEGDTWLRQRFLTFESPHGRPTKQASRRLIRGDSLQNPHLDEGARAQLLSLPPELQARWIWATMDAGSSRLLPELKVIPPVAIPPHWPRWLGVDPARSTGVTCAEWITVNPDREEYHGILPNAPHFYQEYWAEGRDAEIHARAIDTTTGPFLLRGRVMDQTAWHSALKSAKFGQISVADLYIQAGLPVHPSSGDEWTRVMLFTNAQRRGLTVSENCTNLIRQAPRYRVKGQYSAFGPMKIEAKQKFHSVDAAGYVLSVLPQRAGPVDISKERQMFPIGEGVDYGSRVHWEGILANLPKMRGESIITPEFDEAEFGQEEVRDKRNRPGNQEDDLAW